MRVEQIEQRQHQHVGLSNFIIIIITKKATTKNDNRCLSMVRVLVEPACGAALAALYSGIVKHLDPDLPPGDIGKLLGCKFFFKF
jgi:hypothetical protein